MMSNEEFDRRMEFLLNQQAQFDADIQQLKETQKGTGEKLDRAVEGLAETKELAKQTTENLVILTKVTHEGFKFTFESFRNTDAKIDALVDSQIRTAEMIRNLGLKRDRQDEDNKGA